MERLVKETFQYKGKTYQAVPSYDGCKGCAFDKESICLTEPLNELTESCRNIDDSLSLIFKEVKDMEIKDNKLTIDIPEGMEIDILSSNFGAGVIKFKKKKLTYGDIIASLDSDTKLIPITCANCEKVIAINKLMDIANYYNKGWKPNWNNKREDKYYIHYINNKLNDYTISCSNTTNNSSVYFKNREDANAVMCNSNFKNILDAIFKN